MPHSESVTVTSVADARIGLSSTLRRFREDAGAEAVILGSHRRPEAALVPYERYVALVSRSNQPGPLLPELRARSGTIRRLARANNLTGVAVFGSVARGEDGPESDIDLLVDPAATATYFDLSQFAFDVETLMGRAVDVVSRNALTADDDQGILAAAVSL